jgi:hypothetical protein
MSAVLTKKPGADYATQLTFPAVFAEQAKANNLASMYYPVAKGNSVELMKGSGLQYDYHEQKRLDAHRRCLNGVKDNKASMARYLSSHANYILPKPVLGQRKYANPSNGNQADIYSARPVFGFSGGDMYSSLRGGIRTEEGQKWAMAKLKERIPQLDAIKAAKEAFLMGIPSSAEEGTLQEISNITAKVELYGLLQRVEADVEQGVVNGETMKASQSALKLLFAFTPYAIVRELEELTQKTEYLSTALSTIVDEADGGVAQSVAGRAILKNAEYLAGLYEKMNDYLKRMNGVVGRPRKEREKLSAVFIKSLGFAGLLRNLPFMSARVRQQIQQAEEANPNANPEGDEDVEPDAKHDDDEDDDDDDDDGKQEDNRTFEQKASDDFQRYMGREPKFDRDNRQKFGYKSGAFLGEAFVDDDGKAAQPAPRSNMASAEMSVEEVEQASPSFESKHEEVEDVEEEFDITDDDQRNSRMNYLESLLEPLDQLKRKGEKYDKAEFKKLADEYNMLAEFDEDITERRTERKAKAAAAKAAAEKKAAKERAEARFEKLSPFEKMVLSQNEQQSVEEARRYAENPQGIKPSVHTRDGRVLSLEEYEKEKQEEGDRLEKELMGMFEDEEKEEPKLEPEPKPLPKLKPILKPTPSAAASSALSGLVPSSSDRTMKLLKATSSKEKRLNEKLERLIKKYKAKEAENAENPTDELAEELEELENEYVMTKTEIDETKELLLKLVPDVDKVVRDLSTRTKVKVAKDKSEGAISRVEVDAAVSAGRLPLNKKEEQDYNRIQKAINELPPWIKKDSFSSPEKRREFMENAVRFGYYKPTKATEGNIVARVKGAMKSIGNDIVNLYKDMQIYKDRIAARKAERGL